MAFDAFMYLEGPQNGAPPIEGETKDDTFSSNKAFELRSFSCGANNPSTVGSSGGGSGGGKVSLTGFVVEKFTDNCSPSLWTACCNGGHYDSAVVTLRRAGGQAEATGTEYLRFEFAQVFVNDIQWNGTTQANGFGDDRPTETVKFTFGACKVVYTPQETGGQGGTPNEKMWSVVKNKATMDVA